MIVLFALIGLANAAYLYWQYRQVAKGRPMFCLIGGDCQAVVESKYGRSFGVKNELWGMIYYALIISLSLLNIKHLILNISLIAALFSLYLLFLQSVVLKKYCSWCLLAIFLNLAIFLTSLWGNTHPLALFSTNSL